MRSLFGSAKGADALREAAKELADLSRGATSAQAVALKRHFDSGQDQASLANLTWFWSGLKWRLAAWPVVRE